MQINKIKDYSQLSRGELQLIHIREYFLNSVGCEVQAYYYLKFACICHEYEYDIFCWAHIDYDYWHYPEWQYSEDEKFYEFTKNFHPQFDTIYRFYPV